MLRELYDRLSVLCSWRWATATGEVTGTAIEPGSYRGGIKLTVFYKFIVDNDGLYTGESFWEPFLPENERVRAAEQKVPVGQIVVVRYRADDPSVSRIDSSVWRNL